MTGLLAIFRCLKEKKLTMMYAVLLMCFMMSVTFTRTENPGCLKRIVTPVTEPNTCEVLGDQMQSDGTCVRDCVDPIFDEYNGQTFQLYSGIDVACGHDLTETYNNLEDCIQFCRDDGECLSGSYDSSSGKCLNHLCDHQGDYYDGILPSGQYMPLQNLGPSITFFVKNCY